jgi:hypothetical protein
MSAIGLYAPVEAQRQIVGGPFIRMDILALD